MLIIMHIHDAAPKLLSMEEMAAAKNSGHKV